MQHSWLKVLGYMGKYENVTPRRDVLKIYT